MTVNCNCPGCDESVWLSKKTLNECGGENYVGIHHALEDEGWRIENGNYFCSPECLVKWRRVKAK